MTYYRMRLSGTCWKASNDCLKALFSWQEGELFTEREWVKYGLSIGVPSDWYYDKVELSPHSTVKVSGARFMKDVPMYKFVEDI